MRPFDLARDQSDAGVLGVLKDVEDIAETVDSPTKVFSAAIIPGYSKPGVKASPAGFHGSWKCVGEPIAEEDTEAPDSDEDESTGGCSWKECDVEWGEPAGVWNWNGFTP